MQCYRPLRGPGGRNNYRFSLFPLFPHSAFNPLQLFNVIHLFDLWFRFDRKYNLIDYCKFLTMLFFMFISLMTLGNINSWSKPFLYFFLFIKIGTLNSFKKSKLQLYNPSSQMHISVKSVVNEVPFTHHLIVGFRKLLPHTSK